MRRVIDIVMVVCICAGLSFALMSLGIAMATPGSGNVTRASALVCWIAVAGMQQLRILLADQACRDITARLRSAR